MSRPPKGWNGPYDLMDEAPGTKDLLLAAHEGRTDRVRNLLDAGLSVNARDSIGWTALMAATQGRQVDLMGELLARGADLEFENSFYQTALTIAAIACCPRMTQSPDHRPLELLRAAGATLTLHEAVYLDDLDLARQRLEAGDDPDTAEGSYQGPILMTAADDGNLALVELLLDFGANIEATDDLERRPLLSAAEHGRLDVVRLLLDRGADVQACWSGGSAIHHARRAGHADLVRLLRDRGAVWGIIDALEMGDLPLFLSLVDADLRVRAAEPEADLIEIDQDDPALRWLRRPLVDQIASASSERLAQHAASLGNTSALAALLDRGAAHLLDGIDAHSLIAEAARLGHVATMRLLLDRGADLHATGTDTLTPLAWAFQENRAEAAILLRQAGATL